MHGDPLERAAHLRTDPAFLDAARRDPKTKLVPVWRGRCLVSGRPAKAIIPTVGEAGALLEGAEVVFLGLDGDTAVLLVDLPGDAPAPQLGDARFLDLFVVGAQLSQDEIGLLAYARGMALFHRSARFDPKTGHATQTVDAGFARQAPGGEKLFPRTDPAVMILVTHEERCLIARGPQFPPGMYSALAGFVEPGETLEECVLRETLEETSLLVREPRYVGSQPWPFPRSLMIGFEAEVEDPSTLKLDPEELEDAMWVTRDELRDPKGMFVPPPFSLAYHLLKAWTDR
ncbi:MAG: NAD(+) diphosphatase [Sandaracinaceae bacterium]